MMHMTIGAIANKKHIEQTWKSLQNKSFDSGNSGDDSD